jgi:hypothetical protein
VDVQVVADPAIAGGNHKGLPIHHKSNVADEAFVQNFVRGITVVYRAIGFADKTRPLGGNVGLGHSKQAPAIAKDEVKEECSRSGQDQRLGLIFWEAMGPVQTQNAITVIEFVVGEKAICRRPREDTEAVFLSSSQSQR